MATPGNARNTAVVLDFTTSQTAAEILSAELTEHAEHVEAAAREAGQSLITEARVRALRRNAKQLGALFGSTPSS